MVKRIKKPQNDYPSSDEIDALIVASKTEKQDRDKLFSDIYEKAKVYLYGENMLSNDHKINLSVGEFEILMTEVKKVMDIPRFNTAWRLGFPESHWDYFEQSDFINFMRDKKEEEFKKYLEEFKSGKWSK